MKKLTIIFISLVAILRTNSICAQRVVVVNMIPNAQSNETAQDREPIGHQNSNGFHMVGTAFTPNPMGPPRLRLLLFFLAWMEDSPGRLMPLCPAIFLLMILLLNLEQLPIGYMQAY
jgi:hypothetical protein